MKYPKTNLLPPKSGPNPQGLNISYNTVKEVKEKIYNGGQRRQIITKHKKRS